MTPARDPKQSKTIYFKAFTKIKCLWLENGGLGSAGLEVQPLSFCQKI